MNTRDLNETLRSLNVGLPDDVERLKAAGYYEEAIARIDAYLAEDWTMTQNSPYSQGLCPHMDVQPENPTPHGVDVLRDAMIAQREIMRRIPAEYTWSKADAIAEMQRRVKDFTPEEFEMLDRENRMDWRFVEGEKRYQNRFASTLIATHADLARRQIDPPAQPDSEKERCRRLHEKMAEQFTEEPTVIAPENAPQRTVCWEADLTKNRSFSVQYSYRNTAVYTDPSDTPSAPEQPDFDTEEQPSHIVFTPYIKALAAQLTAGITDPMEKAKRIYDYVTLNVRYHYQPSYFIHESLPEHCARDRRGDCGIMSVTFITLCRAAGIPARWQSGLYVTPDEVGCHDWAMFYVAPKGWLYADCSFGASMARRGDETLRQHYFGNLDPDRMVANSVFAAPFTPPMLGFRADPCDNQTGEVEADGVGLYGDETVSSKELVQYIEE